MTRIKRGHMALTVGGTIGAALLLSGCSPQYLVLNPQGPVGREEMHLIYLSALLCLIVIVPVLVLLAFFIIRYRDKPNNRAPYKPNWDDSKTLSSCFSSGAMLLNLSFVFGGSPDAGWVSYPPLSELGFDPGPG